MPDSIIPTQIISTSVQPSVYVSPVASEYGVAYILRDDFLGTLAAGSVNGSAATPGPGGARAVTDTNTKISVSGGLMNVAAGAVAGDGIMYGSQARTLGMGLVVCSTPTATSSIQAGWVAGALASYKDQIQIYANTFVDIRVNGGTTFTAGNMTSGVLNCIAVVMRSNGSFYFLRSGAANWIMLYASKLGNGALNPSIRLTNANAASVDAIRVPAPLFIITPLASDSFNRANGALGNTDGAGAIEPGGGGLAWTTQTGTWAILTNAAAASALASGIALATVPSGNLNVVAEVAVTRSSGNAGLVLRYADINNYIIAYHDGTNAVLQKVVGGTPTTVITAAATYSAGARLIVALDGTTARLFYNDAAVGSVSTISDGALQTSNAHGVYTSATANSLDNFVCWQRGTNGELNGLFNPYAGS